MGGGGHFRLVPWRFLSFFINGSRERLKTFYFHPYEFDRAFLDAREAVPGLGGFKTRRINLTQNLFKNTMPFKVSALLKRGNFKTFGEYLGTEKPESTVLFSSLRVAV
jgi:hypothetical protein